MSDIAEKIAKELFTNGSGEEAHRLVLELPGERDGGGWCRQAVVDIIRKHLTVPPEKASQG